MIKKEGLLRDINSLQRRMNKIEDDLKIQVGEYDVLDLRDVVMELLGYLKLDLVRVKNNKPFKLRSTAEPRVEEEESTALANSVPPLETEGVITVSVTGTQSGRKSTFIEKILQTTFLGYVAVEINEPDHFIRYKKVKPVIPS